MFVLHCIYLMKHVSVDGLLPLNKIMVFTVLEVSRQAILLSVVPTDSMQ